MIQLIRLAAGPYNISAQEIGLPTSTDSLPVAMAHIAQMLMGLMGGLAVLFIIWGGFQYVLSRGNAKTIQTAKDTILYAVIGLIVAIAAYAIVSFVLDRIS